jgi:hypothetical protein
MSDQAICVGDRTHHRKSLPFSRLRPLVSLPTHPGIHRCNAFAVRENAAMQETAAMREIAAMQEIGA